jgi:hypothetical protein
VLPESACLEILSGIRSAPDFFQRLSAVNEYGQSLLHLAVHLRYRQLAQQLVDWGVGLDVQDIHGLAALHYALQCGDSLMVTILKRRGASMTISDPPDLSENPIVTNPDAEMAGAVGSDTRYRFRSFSEHSSGGSIREHQESVGPVGYRFVDAALFPSMGSSSSDQNGMCDHLYNAPSPSGPVNDPMAMTLCHEALVVGLFVAMLTTSLLVQPYNRFAYNRATITTPSHTDPPLQMHAQRLAHSQENMEAL